MLQEQDTKLIKFSSKSFFECNNLLLLSGLQQKRKILSHSPQSSNQLAKYILRLKFEFHIQLIIKK